MIPQDPPAHRDGKVVAGGLAHLLSIRPGLRMLGQAEQPRAAVRAGP